MGLATPISITTAAGRGAQAGVLIKDAEALERMARVDTVIVDKTGTLTEGRPKLTDVVPTGDKAENDLLTMAAALERGSEHPLAEAIVEGALARGLTLPNATEFEAVTGKGVKGMVDGQVVALGNPAMMAEINVDASIAEFAADDLRESGKTQILLRLIGLFPALSPFPIPIRESPPNPSDDLLRSGPGLIRPPGANRKPAEPAAQSQGFIESTQAACPKTKKA